MIINGNYYNIWFVKKIVLIGVKWVINKCNINLKIWLI